jgi:hypothetical protein
MAWRGPWAVASAVSVEISELCLVVVYLVGTNFLSIIPPI